MMVIYNIMIIIHNAHGASEVFFWLYNTLYINMEKISNTLKGKKNNFIGAKKSLEK